MNVLTCKVWSFLIFPGFDPKEIPLHLCTIAVLDMKGQHNNEAPLQLKCVKIYILTNTELAIPVDSVLDL